jgi:hypothetical protein
MESDLVINQKIKKDLWFKGNKPILKILSYKDWILPKDCWHVIRKQTCVGMAWKAGAEYAINRRDREVSDTAETYKDARYNYMHEQPYIYPNKVFPAIRNYLETTHSKKLVSNFSPR